MQLSGAQELLYDLAAYSRCAEDSSNVGDIGIRARRRYSFGCYSFTWDRMEYNYSSLYSYIYAYIHGRNHGCWIVQPILLCKLTVLFT